MHIKFERFTAVVLLEITFWRRKMSILTSLTAQLTFKKRSELRRQQIASQKLWGLKLGWERLPGNFPAAAVEKTAMLSGALSFETWQMGSPHQWTHLLLETLEILHFRERPYYHPTAQRSPTMDADANNAPGPGLKRVPSKPGLCRGNARGCNWK